MTTAEERMKILKMIQENKITAEEGAKLLKALSSATGQRPRPVPVSRVGGARWLRVRVTDMAKGSSKRVRWNGKTPARRRGNQGRSAISTGHHPDSGLNSQIIMLVETQNRSANGNKRFLTTRSDIIFA